MSDPLGLRALIADRIYRIGYGVSESNLHLSVDRWLSAGKEEIEEFQLRKFNKQWERALRNFALYKDLQAEFGLPPQIDKLDELDDFPVLEKDRIKFYAAKIMDEACADKVMSTGGSTGNPLEFPVNKQNARRAFKNGQIGRAYHGLKPNSRVVLIWGHGHLYPKRPIDRLLSIAKRKGQDWLTNKVRLTAYDLSPDRVQSLIRAIQDLRPEAVIAYSSVIRAIASGGIECLTLGSKVIATSEQIYSSDFELVEQRLGGSLIGEYGCGEFGPIGYTTSSDDQYEVFWESFICKNNADGVLLVTDLDEVAFPFINYSTGDLAKVSDNRRTITNLRGRDNDVIPLPLFGLNDKLVHSEVFTHIIKSVHQGRFNVFLTSEEAGARGLKLEIHLEETVEGVRSIAPQLISRLRGQFPDLDESRLQIDSKYVRFSSISGKEKFVIDHRDRI